MPCHQTNKYNTHHFLQIVNIPVNCITLELVDCINIIIFYVIAKVELGYLDRHEIL